MLVGCCRGCGESPFRYWYWRYEDGWEWWDVFGCPCEVRRYEVSEE